MAAMHMRDHGRPAVARYLVAVLAAAIAIAITRFAIDLVPQAVFIFAFAAVALSAWYGGLGPGMLTAVLSVAVVDVWIIAPTSQAKIIIPIAIFILVASLFSAVVEQLRGAQREGRRLALELADQTDLLQQQATDLEEQNAEMQQMTAELEERQENERELDVATARLAAIVESSEDAIVSKRLDGTILSWNDAAARLFGHTAKEAVGQNILLIIPPEHQEEEPRIVERISQGQRIGNFETVRLHKSGRRIHVSLSISPVRNMAGEIVGASKIVRDITERRESERRQALLAALMQGFAASLDLDTIMSTMARTLVPQFVDWCVVDFIEGDHASRDVRRVAMVHRDPARQADLVDISRAWPPNIARPTFGRLVMEGAGSVIVNDVSDDTLRQFAADDEHARRIRALGIGAMVLAPLRARGRLLGVVLFARTTEPFSERDREFADEVARRASLAADSAQLYREALAANEAKSNFLATMSHELRTPLTAIIGYEELLADGLTGPVNAPQVQQLRRIKDSANHLLTLIDEILTYSRVEAGRETLRLEDELLAPIIDLSLAMLRPVAHDRGLVLTGDMAKAPAMLRTDAGKLRQILVNLLSNAVKFTETGSVALTVTQDAGDLVVRVADTGLGIPAEHLERIFDPFWQVEQRATRRVGGTGLGLSVSRRLARMLGGDISVESTPGKGTAFTVRLPLGGPVAPSK